MFNPTDIDLSDADFPRAVLEELGVGTQVNWDDRQALQAKWTAADKGWLIDVEWKPTQHGLGAFAAQDVAKGTILRVVKSNRNLIVFSNRNDLQAFLGTPKETQYASKVRFLADYLFGYPQHLDWEGKHRKNSPEEWIYCVAVPGFGTNHSATPNIRVAPLNVDNNDINNKHHQVAAVMVACRDISKGEELRNSYQLCGPAPAFVQEFAKEHTVPLVFPGSNDYV